MSQTQNTGAAPRKMPVAQKATLSVMTLAVMNITAVVSLRGLPSEATYGLTSVFYYIFAAIFFLIPVSIPGVSTVFGAAILLVGVSRLSGRQLWLPARGYFCGVCSIERVWLS